MTLTKRVKHVWADVVERERRGKKHHHKENQTQKTTTNHQPNPAPLSTSRAPRAINFTFLLNIKLKAKKCKHLES